MSIRQSCRNTKRFVPRKLQYCSGVNIEEQKTYSNLITYLFTSCNLIYTGPQK